MLINTPSILPLQAGNAMFSCFIEPADVAECQDLCNKYHFDQVRMEIKPVKSRRSLDQNAMCWQLINQISLATGQSREDIYLNTIRNIGVSDILCIQDKAVEDFCRRWKSKGLGYTTETLPSKIEGCTNVIVYYGTSAYDTQEMSRIIDLLIQDAESVGVHTAYEYKDM